MVGYGQSGSHVRSFHEADEAELLNRQSMTPEERVEVFLAIQQRGLPNGVDEKIKRVCRILTLEQS